MSHGDGTAIAWAALVAFFVGVTYVIATQGNEVHDRHRSMRRAMRRIAPAMRGLTEAFGSIGHAMPSVAQATTRLAAALSKSPPNISGGAPGVDRIFGTCSLHGRYELPSGSVELGDVERGCPICVHESAVSRPLAIISGGASEADRVREHHYADPTMSDEDFGRLVEEADERDRDREARLEEGFVPGCARHAGDPHNLCEACWAVEP